ncbi:MAG: hypothetical protein KC983_02990 [Phycisphaerales bacterium]|nr:hypothetical protein [Phycisphaerales bacterium]
MRSGLLTRLSRLERPSAAAGGPRSACSMCIERDASRDADAPRLTWCFRGDETPEREFCPACGALVRDVLEIEFDS